MKRPLIISILLGIVLVPSACAAPVEATTLPDPIPETLTASVSAYTSDPGETDDDPTTTASGTTVHQGTAACPSRYSFGTTIEVDGKRYTCEDRMHARYRAGNYFDLWMPEKGQAREWGRRNVTVTITYVPEQSNALRQPDPGS